MSVSLTINTSIFFSKNILDYLQPKSFGAQSIDIGSIYTKDNYVSSIVLIKSLEIYLQLSYILEIKLFGIG